MNDCEARFLGDVFEGAVSAVSVQNVAIHAGDEDVGETIVVIVRRGNPHRVSIAGHAGLLRNISECQITVVLVQPVVELGTGFTQRRDGSSVGEINIEATIIVKVEYSHASEHQLHLVKLSARVIIELEVNSSLMRNFVK